MDIQEQESGKKSRLKKAFSYKEEDTKDKNITQVEEKTIEPSLSFEKRELSYSTTLSFRIDAKLADRLDKLARELRWTKSEILVELLKRSLPALEKQNGITE